MNKEEYIFPTDCSKDNIRYLLDIGCRVVVTITYKRYWETVYHTDTCEIRCYHHLFVEQNKFPTDILKMSPTIPGYFWNHYEFTLYINRNDLL